MNTPKQKTRAAYRDKFVDLLYPKICVLCNGLVKRAGRHICWRCFAALPLNSAKENICGCCGLIPEGVVSADFICDICTRRKPAFEVARTAAPFRGGVRELIHLFKYSGATWLCRDLVDLLEGAAGSYFDLSEVDLVAPVPLHISRLRQRGYNQADLLAANLGKRLKIESVSVIQRVRATSSQTRLGLFERRENMKGAFKVIDDRWVAGRTILVLDDVMTTGATLSEAAKELHRAGAWRVWALAVARGL